MGGRILPYGSCLVSKGKAFGREQELFHDCGLWGLGSGSHLQL